MARSRPVLLTAALSAAAVLGYLAYRSFSPTGESNRQPWPTPPGSRAPSPARQVVATLPDFSLGNLAGEPQSIQSWPGKPLLINFWATWCGPCLREIPMLKELQTGRPDLQVVGIAIDKRDPVVEFAGTMQFNYPILIGQNEAWAAARRHGRQHLRPAVHGFHGRRRQHPRRPYRGAACGASRGIPSRRRRSRRRPNRRRASPGPHRRAGSRAVLALKDRIVAPTAPKNG